MSLLSMAILLIIALYDLQSNRIPNLWVLALCMSGAVHWFAMDASLQQWGLALAGGVAMFLSALFLYSVKAMAPGDVKLLGALGFVFGWGNLIALCLYIALGGGLVALCFLLFHHSEHPITAARQYLRYRFLSLGQHKSLVIAPSLSMPFAPCVLIGVVLFNYLG
ncbi:hypothetical protein VST7929_01805 [Vibrio stylophorae]|uniref:Prepilin type IV endopeptidase peptidase domain-containing protein n=1 Tax=Vibrio stylophorae TaxID=659351 RepID=A0ABM8ZVA7_9VIBR|nr:prepilin peptidase [Vibrio stylophorae]CAH0533928.1 hypothetical protein VST7929_01805 [Vibrio stylophorae]